MKPRDLVVAATNKAEREIGQVLQRFHDETGFIPTGISFDMIDTREIGESGNHMDIHYVHLVATT